MTAMSRMPAGFFGHGSPLNAQGAPVLPRVPAHGTNV